MATLLVAILVVVGAAVAGGFLTGTVPWPLDLTRPGSDADTPIAGGGDVGVSGASGSESSTLPPASQIPAPTILSVDLHPVGPLDPELVPITRTIGAPEVSAFPTPFDRSLRLSGAVSGICAVLPSGSEADPAITLDMYLGDAGTGGTLVFAHPDGDVDGGSTLVLELGALEHLDRDAWYRLDASPDGRLEVTSPTEEGVLYSGQLGAADPMAPPPGPDEVCIQSSLESSDASLFLDNLRVEP